MRVITWNMGMGPHGRGTPATHDQAWHYLLGLGPDLALVQEALPPRWLRSEGTVVQGPFREWGSAIFSPRFPLAPHQLPANSNLRQLGNYLAFATAGIPNGDEVLISSIHARAKKATPQQMGDLDPKALQRQAVGVPRVNDAVFAGLVELNAGSFIFGGDFNIGRTTSVQGAGEEFFDRVTKKDWCDCVNKHLNGEEVRTWFGEEDSILIQDDHVFTSQRLGDMLTGAWVADEAHRDLGLSDHAPLVIDFEVESLAMSNLRS